MFGIHDFVLFLTTGILLNLAPGPDTAYILGRSIAQGRSAGIASALGISFLAFLPQFIDPTSTAKVPAFLTLGLTFVATGTLRCLILAWFASAFSERLRASNTISAVLNRAVGSLFIFLGLRLAVSK